MTVSSTATRAEYLGNAVTTAFSAPFAYLSTGEVKVYLDGVLQSTGYTVSAAPAASGAVTFSSAPGAGVKVVVTRATAKTQNIDYVANDAFAADVTEGGFDRAMLAVQDNAAAIGRSLRVADHAAAVDALSLTGASLKYVIVNSAEDGFDLADSAPQEINVTISTAFWLNVDGVEPRIWRMRDRVFVGNATGMGPNRQNTNDTWVPDSASGANWAPRDSQFVVMHDRGGLAVTGMSRTSDSDGIGTPPAAIGVAGFVINDSSASQSGWALYADVQHEGATRLSFGLEVAGKNKSSDYVPTSYGLNYGVHGLWLAGGGDATYGGAPTNPSTSAISIIPNASTWNAGIVFGASALTGTDGVTGTANAIEMAKGHIVRWRGPSGINGATIMSDVATSGKQVGVLFNDDAVVFTGNEGTPIGRVIRGASGTPANYVQLSSNASGNGPRVQAVGTDTNVDLRLVPQGTGVVSFGTLTAIGAETITGYITIKDSGGTLRKLAVVS